jgi:GT2 family glycosyltransferase
LASKISISVLTYNRRPVLELLLTSLRRIRYSPLEILVVDNCSEDGTQEMIADRFSDIKYIKSEKNVGACARNLGMRAAGGEVIVTLDDDIVGIGASELSVLEKLFRERTRLGAVNFKVTDYFTRSVCNWVHHRAVEENVEREFPTYEITEGAVAFRKEAVEKAGYYAENFFLSHEGPDLALRLINCGYEVIYSNKIGVRHRHSNLGRGLWMNYYYDTRNQFWLAARNLPACYASLYLFRGLSSMLIYSLRDGYLLHWLKAIGDGLKGLSRALDDRNVLSREAMSIIRKIDSNRPGLVYSLRKKLLKRGIRL